MADKYMAARGLTTHFVPMDEWLARNLDGLSHSGASELIAHGVPLKYAAVLFVGWRRRHDRAGGGLYEDVARCPDGSVAVFDARSLFFHHRRADGPCDHVMFDRERPVACLESCTAYTAIKAAGGGSMCGILSLAPAALMAQKDALHQFSRDFLHMEDRGISDFNDDHAIASTMIAMQTVVYLLAKTTAPVAAASLTRLCRTLFTRVQELCALYPATQRIIDALRDDANAEDMLQKALSGILARRPLTQVERLRIVETILKRTYKHHDSLVGGGSGDTGMFAVLSIAPVMVAHGSGILSLDRAVDQVLGRVARMPALLKQARAAGAMGEGILLHTLASESGLAGTSPFAFYRLASWCKEKDRRGFLLHLRESADFGAHGFAVSGMAVSAGLGLSVATGFPRLAAWLAEHIEAAGSASSAGSAGDAAGTIFPGREGVPVKYAAVLLTGWRQHSPQARALASGAQAAASARVAGEAGGAAVGVGAVASGQYEAIKCHADGSLAVFDIRSLLHHLQGNAHCPITAPWSKVPTGSRTAQAAIDDAAACGGAGAASPASASSGSSHAAAPASAASTSASASVAPQCDHTCAASLALQQLWHSLDSCGVMSLAPVTVAAVEAGAGVGCATSRFSGPRAIHRLALTMLHLPESSAVDVSALAREAAEHGVAATLQVLHMAVRHMLSRRSSASLRSTFSLCRALACNLRSLCAEHACAQEIAVRTLTQAQVGGVDLGSRTAGSVASGVAMQALSGFLLGHASPHVAYLRSAEATLKSKYGQGCSSIVQELTAAETAAAEKAAAEEGWCSVTRRAPTPQAAATASVKPASAASPAPATSASHGFPGPVFRASKPRTGTASRAAPAVAAAAAAPKPVAGKPVVTPAAAAAPAAHASGSPVSGGSSAVDKLFTALVLIPSLIALCTGALSTDEAVARVLASAAGMQALIHKARNEGPAGDGYFLHQLASVAGPLGDESALAAFHRLVGWCKSRSASGRLLHQDKQAQLGHMGFPGCEDHPDTSKPGDATDGEAEEKEEDGDEDEDDVDDLHALAAVFGAKAKSAAAARAA